jgi:hypothetical protein
VNQTSLTNELTRLKTNLNQSSFDLIFDINNLSAYYHLKLARCTVVHVDDRVREGEVSLILTVPIRRREIYYSLIEGFTVPFLEITATGPQLCSIRFDHDLIVLKNGYPILVTNSQTSSCSIERGICYVDEYNSVPSTSVDCVRTLLRYATVAEVLNSCPYTCRPANSDEPSVVSIGNLFALTNIDIYTMVECTFPNNTLSSRHLIYNDTHIAGTYFVHLTSCLCSITFTNRPSVFPLWPCREQDMNQTSPIIKLVIPIRWSHINDSIVIKAMTVEGEIFPDDG